MTFGIDTQHYYPYNSTNLDEADHFVLSKSVGFYLLRESSQKSEGNYRVYTLLIRDPDRVTAVRVYQNASNNKWLFNVKDQRIEIEGTNLFFSRLMEAHFLQPREREDFPSNLIKCHREDNFYQKLFEAPIGSIIYHEIPLENGIIEYSFNLKEEIQVKNVRFKFDSVNQYAIKISAMEAEKLWKVTRRTATTRLKKMCQEGLLVELSTGTFDPYKTFILAEHGN